MIELRSMPNDTPTPTRRGEQASVGEVVEFVKTYARQETVGPLKGAGRWIAFGAAGGTMKLAPVSAKTPSFSAETSMLTRSPARIACVPGMPCATAGCTLMQVAPGKS